MSNIEYASQLRKNDLVTISFYGEDIKQNCIVLDTIQDHYFTKGLVIYLNGTQRETIDLENTEGLWVKRLEV